MSFSVQRSVVESFNFNGKHVRSVYVKDVGQCLVSKDVYEAIGYEEENGKKAIQNLVPSKYKLRFGDVKPSLSQGGRYFPAAQGYSLVKSAWPLLLPFKV